MSLHPFIGRKRELSLLRELLLKKSASFVTIRGRRRIGKSRLAQEFAKNIRHFVFSGLPPTKEISAQDQREEFARQLHRSLSIPLPRAEDWGDLFWHLAQATQKGSVVIVLDEISWMGSKDPTFLGKLKTAWDLYFKNNPKLVFVVCGSVSSWIEKNILSSTGFMGRTSLNIVLEELPLHECNAFWNAEKHIVSSFEKFKILSVTGGVPRYLEEILPAKGAEENIRRMCFQKEGLLFNEFDQIFSDLFSSRSALYKEIVQRLAEGSCELAEIYQALDVSKSGIISEYLEDLATSGFISKDFTWHLKTGKESKLGHFRLKDNYLRFYLKYIDPNKRKIEHHPLKLLPQWQSIMGLQFENLVLSNRKTLYTALDIDPADIIYDNPYFQRKTKTSPGCQIDYLIQNRFGTCYLCEIKFSAQEMDISVIKEVQEKIRRLARPKHTSIKPVLIHVNGVSQAVVDSEFFAAIIHFEQFLESHLRHGL